MRRRLFLLAMGVLAAVLGVASARASGAGTTTTTGTTETTTTTTAPSYAPLATSSLPTGCVGAGAAAVAMPSHPVVALGTPASDLGPSGYPGSASVVAFTSSTVSGSTCTGTTVALASVSLFGGVVTASSVGATDGKGTVAGLEIDGVAVSAGAGQTVSVEDWGQLTLGETFGRLTAPLVLQLLQAHGGLPAGTRIAVAFSVTARPGAKPRKKHSSPSTQTVKSQRHGKGAGTTKKQRPQPQKPPPDFPASPSPLTKGGVLTDAVQENPIVSIATRYLGVPYQWGGASPRTGFDCSGLVQYVFAQLGVPLEHYAAAQFHSPGGVWIPPNRLRPGDLVFFIGADGTRKAPGHVGIYVSDGYFIDAPHTGSFVRIDNLTEPRLANQYVGARRVVGQPFVARHVLNADKAAASPTALRLGFSSSIDPLSEPLGVAAAGAATVRTTSHRYWIWIGVALTALLLLVSAGGGIVHRRRQPPDAVSSGEASS